MTEHRTKLVSSNDVTGTNVYSRNGDNIGEIDHIAIDKESGKVAYCDMSFGGFLGLGEDHYTIPWGALHYDTRLDGFVTSVTKEQVEGAPEKPSDWQANRQWEEHAHTHYGVPYYWV